MVRCRVRRGSLDGDATTFATLATRSVRVLPLQGARLRSELDIEISPSWLGGPSCSLAGDRIEYDTSSVGLVDRAVAELVKGVPRHYLYVNAWSRVHRRPMLTLVDWIEQSGAERLTRVRVRDLQPPNAPSGESPAMRAMRSSSAGQA